MHSKYQDKEVKKKGSFPKKQQGKAIVFHLMFDQDFVHRDREAAKYPLTSTFQLFLLEFPCGIPCSCVDTCQHLRERGGQGDDEEKLL
jgi:hypothetical protein